jgi:hypothetical protein
MLAYARCRWWQTEVLNIESPRQAIIVDGTLRLLGPDIQTRRHQALSWKVDNRTYAKGRDGLRTSNSLSGHARIPQ